MDDVTGFACPSCPTVKQSLTVELVSNPDELTAAMQADAAPVAYRAKGNRQRHRSRGMEMTEIEQKAQALVRDVADGYEDVSIHHVHNAKALRSALCRAIEQHEQFKREVSDVVEKLLAWPSIRSQEIIVHNLSPFILPKLVDPLVEALADCFGRASGQSEADDLRVALARRGLEVREIEG